MSKEKRFDVWKKIWVIRYLSSPKREIEYWRGNVYNKLFWELDIYDSPEEKNRYKMQEFNEIFALWEDIYSQIFWKRYREKFQSFLWIIQSFLDNKNFDNTKGKGLNYLIATLINNLLPLREGEEWEEFHHAIKNTFWDEMFEESKQQHFIITQKQVNYKSKAQISEIPNEWEMFFQKEIVNILGQRKREKWPSRLPPLWKENNFIPPRLDNSSNNKKERSPVRSIEFLLREAYRNFFKWKEEYEEAWRYLNKVKHAYALSKWKFQEILRNDRSRFFEHLRNSAFNIIRYSKNKTFDAFLVALLHDIIEDTDIDFRTLRSFFWEKIALAVYSISKDSVLNHIKNDDEEYQSKKEYLEKSWLLNDNKRIKIKYEKIYKKYRNIFEWEKNNVIREKTRFSQKVINRVNYNPYKTLSQSERENVEKEIPSWMTLEKFAKCMQYYEEIEDKYKKERNTKYMEHFKNLESFKESLQKNIKNLENQWIKINLSENNENEINEIIKIACEWKFSDRINNLETAETRKDNSEEMINKNERKIEETIHIFIPFSEEFDKSFWGNYNDGLKKAIKTVKRYTTKNPIKRKILNILSF